MSILNNTYENEDRVMFYRLPHPGLEKQHQNDEQNQRVQETPDKPEKGALIFKLELSKSYLFKQAQILFTGQFLHIYYLKYTNFPESSKVNFEFLSCPGQEMILL